MIKVINGGMQALVEDWPGRLGYNGQGMSASGATDNLALRLGNLLLGNKLGEAGIEIAAGLFQCQFEEAGIIAITGARMRPTINDKPVKNWETIFVNPGDVLKFGTYDPERGGFRAYLCVAGGIDVEPYLGSKSTCVFGNYGGFEGRPLKPNDVVKVGKAGYAAGNKKRRIKASFIPEHESIIKPEGIEDAPDFAMERVVKLRAIPGMNAAPDFATEKGMDYLFSHTFPVSINANRSAMRLEELPDWFFSRDSGGVGGSHPSNIVDHAYNIRGGLNITGNTPSLLIADGPTLGGFICALDVINVDLWKIGQAVPGAAKFKFELTTLDEAIKLRKERRESISEKIVEEFE